MKDDQITQVVILAGGLGTRIRSINSELPKALIEVCGKPFLDWQLRWLKKNGVKKVLLCIGYLADAIENFAKDGSQWGLEIDYHRDGKTLLGTGGVLRSAYDAKKIEDNFFLLYGDSFLPIDFQSIYNFYKSNQSTDLMTVFKNNNQFDKSNVQFNSTNYQIQLYDKHYVTQPMENFDYIDYGLSILNKATLQTIPTELKFDLSELYHQLSLQKKLTGYEVTQRFYEIGTPQGLKEFEAWLKENLYF